MPADSTMFGMATCLLGGYLCGATPFGLWIALRIRGIDPRQHGSRNIGATNVGRVLGRKWGFLVLVLDALKGGLPTWFLPLWFVSADDPLREHAPVLTGLAAILGHMFSFWLGFRGGKGVATALGVTAVLIPWGMVAGLTMFLVVLVCTRYVSLGSILGSITLAVTQIAQTGSDALSVGQVSRTVYSLLVPALILWSHRQNIQRLLAGTEHRLGQPRSSTSAADSEPVSPQEPA